MRWQFVCVYFGGITFQLRYLNVNWWTAEFHYFLGHCFVRLRIPCVHTTTCKTIACKPKIIIASSPVTKPSQIKYYQLVHTERHDLQHRNHNRNPWCEWTLSSYCRMVVLIDLIGLWKSLFIKWSRFLRNCQNAQAFSVGFTPEKVSSNNVWIRFLTAERHRRLIDLLLIYFICITAQRLQYNKIYMCEVFLWYKTIQKHATITFSLQKLEQNFKFYSPRRFSL